MRKNVENEMLVEKIFKSLGCHIIADVNKYHFFRKADFKGVKRGEKNNEKKSGPKSGLNFQWTYEEA